MIEPTRTGRCRGRATAASCRAVFVGRPMAACSICLGCSLDQIARCPHGNAPHARTRHWAAAFQVSGSSCSRASRHIPCKLHEGLHRLQARQPAGETALCLESRARISWRVLTIHIGRIRRFLSARTAGPYQDGLTRSDATDTSPLHSGASACARVRVVCVRACVCACLRAGVCVCLPACHSVCAACVTVCLPLWRASE
jgi:hypothetical protein